MHRRSHSELKGTEMFANMVAMGPIAEWNGKKCIYVVHIWRCVLSVVASSVSTQLRSFCRCIPFHYVLRPRYFVGSFEDR